MTLGPTAVAARISQALLLALLVAGATAAPSAAPASLSHFDDRAFNDSVQVRTRRSLSGTFPGRARGSGLSYGGGDTSPGQLIDLSADSATQFLEYETLCREKRVRVQLRNEEAGVDYYPAQYDEVLCENAEESVGSGSNRCAHPGFKCVQRYATLYVMRRSMTTDCYLQKATIKVPSGCECMWPTRQLGGAGEHY